MVHPDESLEGRMIGLCIAPAAVGYLDLGAHWRAAARYKLGTSLHKPPVLQRACAELMPGTCAGKPTVAFELLL